MPSWRDTEPGERLVSQRKVVIMVDVPERTAGPDIDALDILRRIAPLQCEPDALGVKEAGIANAYAELMGELGIEAELLEVEEGRPSVIGRVRGSGGGQSILFNTHLLVPTSPLEEWHYDPYAITVEDGKAYGMGVSDTKAGIVAMMLAARQIAAEGPMGDVIIGLGAGGERAGFIGTKPIVERVRPDVAVVCEPTSLDIVYVQYGCLWVTFTVRGKQGFVDAGVSALHKSMPLYRALLELNEEVRERRHPLLPPSKLAINALQAGEHWVLTPHQCVVKVDRRIIPGETVQSATEEFEAILATLRSEDPQFDASMELALALPPVEMSAESSIVAAASSAITDRRGKAPQLLGIKGFTEMVHMYQAGVEAIICGPGSTAVIHAADEYIPVDDLYDAVDVYAGIARRITATPSAAG
jgi:acetylornithine deacetylase/succinyl-diaminopimelate desuccinylase-like protein